MDHIQYCYGKQTNVTNINMNKHTVRILFVELFLVSFFTEHPVVWIKSKMWENFTRYENIVTIACWTRRLLHVIAHLTHLSTYEEDTLSGHDFDGHWCVF